MPVTTLPLPEADGRDRRQLLEQTVNSATALDIDQVVPRLGRVSNPGPVPVRGTDEWNSQ
ncbi:hypothetical protein [Streptomyces sp. Mg1]|uniref:hypothetical protein n=1 Tax=Streptomyces sp. Mg1 TaxID=465541 RepID=UPI001F19DA6A|nr:hypothetical protein [Streptomyces sp. Mg1]